MVISQSGFQHRSNKSPYFSDPIAHLDDTQTESRHEDLSVGEVVEVENSAIHVKGGCQQYEDHVQAKIITTDQDSEVVEIDERCLICFEALIDVANDYDSCHRRTRICARNSWDHKTERIIMLTCSHKYHIACIREFVHKGSPSLSLTFQHMFCPLRCSPFLGDHPDLKDLIQHDGAMRSSSIQGDEVQTLTKAADGWYRAHNEHNEFDSSNRELMELAQAINLQFELMLKVVTAAVERLRLENPAEVAVAQTNGDERAAAMGYYTYFPCHICAEPFFGGARRCGEGLPEPAAAELICPACNGFVGLASCVEHGTDHGAYRCVFCCRRRPAIFICAADYYCGGCHGDQSNLPRPCDPRDCLFDGLHPAGAGAPGRKAPTRFLGCALCCDRASLAAGSSP